MLRERIAQLRVIQDTLKNRAPEVDAPLVVFYVDDSSWSVHGNEAGLLRLASDLVEVASGGQTDAHNAEWLEAAWLPLEAIVLDPQPRRETPKQTLLGKVAAYGFLILVLSVFTAGAVTIVSWLRHSIHS